ncbi:hypothetical protein N0V94_004911 [Neodidymelliopsis sp. IMI 364377]|nr:hypothetical protein N0V94_004911 [Neodidymelliopsis sp. IMI 364377]
MSNSTSDRIIHQFSAPTWLENIATLRNGSLLTSVIGRPEVHLVNPLATPPTSNLVATIPDANAVFGITELKDNIFAVAAGAVTPANVPVAGSFVIWVLDFTTPDASLSKLTAAPEVSMVNGMAALNPHTLLLADSWAGNIASLDTETGAPGIWLADKSTAADFTAQGLPLGVNGIKVHAGFVYYTNTVFSSLNRIAISSSGAATGDVEVLAQGEKVALPDDFAVLDDGSVILGRPMSDEVVRVNGSGEVSVLAKVEGVTAVALGRTEGDKGVAYLSSMGGFGEDGKVKDGGRVVAVEV